MNFYFLVLIALLSALIVFLRYKYTYWERNGIKQLKTNILYGNFFKLNSLDFTDLVREVYDEFKGKCVLAGTYIFTKPVAVIIDIDLVKLILVKDFNNFINRTKSKNAGNDPLSSHLFLLHDEKWRALRSKLTPTFTSGKMKLMFSTIVMVGTEFKAVLEEYLKNAADGNIEAYDLMGRFTTDVIGACAFGIECNSLKDPNTKFRRLGKRVVNTKDFSVRWRLFILTYGNALKRFGIKRFPKDIEKFMIDIVNHTVEEREKYNIRRNDFIDLLMELRNSKDANGQPALTIPEMAAQVFVFFVAGFETSSSNMTFGLYELAENPSIQEKVRKEIMEVLGKYNGELTYEAIMEMSYLDLVINETLRKYPPGSSLTRITKEDYQVPGTDIILKKGTKVRIPIKCIHNDPDIYDNPHEFRPERFRPEEVLKRHSQSFLGFGDGPRNCIGIRFARMQVKIGLITLLRSFEFSFCEKTPKKIKMSPRSFMLVPGEDVWLKMKRLIS